MYRKRWRYVGTGKQNAFWFRTGAMWYHSKQDDMRNDPNCFGRARQNRPSLVLTAKA